MPGRDVGVEEARTSAASLLIPCRLIEGPGNVVAKVRIEGVAQELKAGARHAELVGVALLTDGSVFHLTAEDLGISRIADGAPSPIVGAVAVPNLGEQAQFQKEFRPHAEVQPVVDVDAVVGFGNLFPGLQDSQALIVFFLGDDAF